MKKIIILFLLFCLLLPLVLSDPTVQVTYPNGGEVLSGITTITWYASSGDNSQDLNAKLSYSYSPGGEHNLIVDTNLLDLCPFGEDVFWQELDANVQTLYPIEPNLNMSNGGTDIVYFEDEWHYFLAGFANDGNFVRAFTYNQSTDSWAENTDLNAGLDDFGKHLSKFFVLDGSLYALGIIGGSDLSLRGAKYNTTSDEWETNTDIISGDLTGRSNQFYPIHFFPITDYFSYDWLIVEQTYLGNASFSSTVSSYLWNATAKEWVSNDALVTDFNIHMTDDSEYSNVGSAVFVKDSVLYGLIRETSAVNLSSTSTKGIRYDSPNAKWVMDSDINKDLTTNRFVAIGQFTDDETTNALLAFGSNIFVPYISDNQLKTGFRTDTNVLCSYDWDTTSVPNFQYYLDVNIMDNDKNTTILDSSDSFFTLINWTDSDISCECVSNCSSCSLDVNAFVVVPTDEALDVSIKVVNGGGLKNIGFRLDNSINNAKQYFIYTSADETNYSFDDTATYGSLRNNGVQKIWKQEGNSRFFEHSFINILQTNETKYFDLRFRSPMFSWASMVNNSDWDVSYLPQQTDQNGHSIDEYQVSSYANIRNEFIEEISDINSSLTTANYVFQVNAKVDSSTGTILADGVSAKGVDPTTSATVVTKEVRYSFPSISKKVLSLISNETTSRLYTLSDYALIQRGFFTKEFDILNKFGNPLELYVDDTNTVQTFLIEGQDFKVKGQLYDRENTIDFMEVSVFLELNNDSNKVLYKKIDIGELTTGTEQFIDYEIDLKGVFDLTAAVSNYRDMIVEVKITDSDLDYSEIQHSLIKLRQFPFLPDDLFLGIDLINKLKSEHPQGRITLRTNSPEAIRGLTLRFLNDATELPSSNFSETLYNGVDFDCIGGDCSFDFEIDNWIFPSYGFWRFVVTADLTTQSEDFNNFRTTKTLNFYVNFKEFKMAKIVETRERENHDYKPTERIPLALVLQDSDGADLSKQLNVFLTVEDCNSSDEELGIEAAFGCKQQTDINYSWKEHLYDELTGINYYFFESVMVKDSHITFSDSNYMRIVGHVQDAKNQRAVSDFKVLLTTKCKTNIATNCHALDIFCFVGSALTSVLEFGIGCDEQNGKIITFDTNGSQEGRIDWDSTKSPAQPNLECFGCMNADQNNTYRDNLQQDLLCGGWYTIGEQNIDKLTFRLGNIFSDYAEQDDDLKQYLEMNIPYSLIYYNDPILLKNSLEKSSIGTCSEIGTTGELLWCGLSDLFVGVGNPLADVFTGATSTGFITNVGADCNFNNAFDPNFLDGVFFVKVTGLKVTNMFDYVEIDESIRDSDPSSFFKTLRDLGIDKKEETTQIIFYGNDLEVFATKTVQSNLVINEEYSDLSINEANIDPDIPRPNFRTLPTILKFNVLMDLIYNDETTYIRRSVPIFITTTITPQFGSADAIRRGIGKGLDDFIENPTDTLLMIPFNTILNLDWWANGGWFWIFVVFVAISLFALFRGRPVDKGS